MSAHAVAQTASRRRRLNPKVPSDRVLEFREFVNGNLFGQQEGKDLLEYAYAAANNPLRDRSKPIAFIINAGKSRTGKTHSVSLLATKIHGRPDAYQRIDMSEFMDKYSISNLKGSGRGYINNEAKRSEGYASVAADQKHDYAEFMNHNLEWSKKGSNSPISIVLLDELDKACREVFLILLGIMDHGKLTLGNGEVVDFTNTIFIAACNLGMEEVEKEETGGIGFTRQGKKLNRVEIRQEVLKALKAKAPPEFRNRVNELGGVAIYDDLTYEQMEQVVVRELAEFQKRVTETGFHFYIKATQAARTSILTKALANDGNLGNVKGLIKKEIDTPIGVETEKRTIRMGDYVVIDVESVKAEGDDEPHDEFVFDIDPDALGFLAGAVDGALPNAAPAATGGQEGEGASQPVDDDVAETVRQMGSLLGFGPNSLVVLVQKPFERRTGELSVDQLMGLGMMPDVSSMFTGLHNMTMVERIAEAKLKAERFPELRQSFILELENVSSLALNDEAQRLVRDLVRMMGVEVLESHSTHTAPYKFTLKVKALPESIVMAKFQFPKMKYRPVNQPAE